MKKLLKRVLLLVCAVLLMGALVFTANAETVASGTCGENLIWSLDDGGTLTISGSGAMEDYSSHSKAPWHTNAESVLAVEIEGEVTGIGAYAFADCCNLVRITIGESVTGIGNDAFNECRSLVEINLEDMGAWLNISMDSWSANPLMANYKSKSIYLNGELATDVVIPDHVTHIGKWAFARCGSIVSVVIPDGVTDIADEAFIGCGNLEEITIADSVTSIGSWAFSECSSLKRITIPQKVTAIGEYTFYQCSSLSEVHIGQSVTRIGDWAFGHCISLLRLNIPQSMRKIGNCAFYECSSLPYVDIPENVAAIGDYGFEACSGLTSITFGGDAPALGNDVFYAVSATAFYPANNPTWTSAVMQNYGGDITWVPLTAKPAAPVIKASNDPATGKIKLSWNKVSGAVKYQIVRSLDGKNWSHLAYSTGTSATNTKTDAGKTYYYKIRAIDANGNKSAYSNVVTRMCDLPQPKVSVTNVASTGKIKLSWTAVTGAAKYQIVRSTDNKTWTHLAYTTGTSAINTKTDAGTTYYYKVRAIHGTSSSANSAYAAVVTRMCDLARPVVKVALNAKGKPVLSWDKVEGAVKYTVYVYDANGNLLKTASTANLKMTHSSAVAGTTYKYRIVAVHTKTSANSAKSATVSITAK